MTDNTAPERIWVWPGPARGWNYGSFVPKLFNDLADPGTEYIRADLHNAALEAAKREAFNEGIEAGMSIAHRYDSQSDCMNCCDTTHILEDIRDLLKEDTDNEK